MTYSPGSPGSSGYPPGSYGAPSPSYAPVADPGPSTLPHYLNIAVVLLGLGAYVAAFGPVFTASTNLGPFSVEATSTGGILLTLAAVLAALLAAIALLPKTKSHPTVVALLAVLGVLAVVEQLVNRPQAATIGWALWVVLALVILQAIAAVLVLLYETGVLTPPAPKPRYEQPQYGQYGHYSQYGAPRRLLQPAAQRARLRTGRPAAGTASRLPVAVRRRLPAGPVDRRVLPAGAAGQRPAGSADTAHRVPELQPAAGGRVGPAPCEHRPQPRVGAAVVPVLGSAVRFVRFVRFVRHIRRFVRIVGFVGFVLLTGAVSPT